MVSKEKLVDGDLAYIMQLLCQTEYGEHNILIYPDLDSFREIYSKLTMARLKNNHDLVMLLPHYETEKSVRQSLTELEIDVQEVINNGSLEILDSHHAFFDPAQRFLDTVRGSVNKAVRSGLAGAIIIADMGSFYHRQLLDELANHECRIPPREPESKYTIFCCYHSKDYERLTEEQETRLCENHYRNLYIQTARS